MHAVKLAYRALIVENPAQQRRLELVFGTWDKPSAVVGTIFDESPAAKIKVVREVSVPMESADPKADAQLHAVIREVAHAGASIEATAADGQRLHVVFQKFGIVLVHPATGNPLAAVDFTAIDPVKETMAAVIVPGTPSQRMETVATWEGVRDVMRQSGIDLSVGKAPAPGLTVDPAPGLR